MQNGSDSWGGIPTILLFFLLKLQILICLLSLYISVSAQDMKLHRTTTSSYFIKFLVDKHIR